MRWPMLGALSLIRSKAADFGIDPDRLGMLGFSAGGHLTAWAATNFDQRGYETIDDVDKVGCRPSFAVLIYPGGVVKKGTAELSPEIRVTASTPPSFLAHVNDDPVTPLNSVAYYTALKNAGVPVELHIYSTGGHGFGMRPGPHPNAEWPSAAPNRSPTGDCSRRARRRSLETAGMERGSRAAGARDSLPRLINVGSVSVPSSRRGNITDPKFLGNSEDTGFSL